MRKLVYLSPFFMIRCFHRCDLRTTLYYFICTFTYRYLHVKGRTVIMIILPYLQTTAIIIFNISNNSTTYVKMANQILLIHLSRYLLLMRMTKRGQLIRGGEIGVPQIYCLIRASSHNWIGCKEKVSLCINCFKNTNLILWKVFILLYPSTNITITNTIQCTLSLLLINYSDLIKWERNYDMRLPDEYVFLWVCHFMATSTIVSCYWLVPLQWAVMSCILFVFNVMPRCLEIIILWFLNCHSISQWRLRANENIARFSVFNSINENIASRSCFRSSQTQCCLGHQSELFLVFSIKVVLDRSLLDFWYAITITYVLIKTIKLNFSGHALKQTFTFTFLLYNTHETPCKEQENLFISRLVLTVEMYFFVRKIVSLENYVIENYGMILFKIKDTTFIFW